MKFHDALTYGFAWYNRLRPAVQPKVNAAAFGDFMKLLTPQSGDRTQIHALAERWWDSKNTFHFPFGEVTMTPLDFHVITGLPVDGDPISLDENLYIDMHRVFELLGR